MADICAVLVPHDRVGPTALRDLKFNPRAAGWDNPAPLTNTEFCTRIQIPNRFVGPPVLRQLRRGFFAPWSDLAPITNTEFATRVQLPHALIGPPALRRRRPTFNAGWLNLAPVTNSEFAYRIRLPHNRIGPPVLRMAYRSLGPNSVLSNTASFSGGAETVVTPAVAHRRRAYKLYNS